MVFSPKIIAWRFLTKNPVGRVALIAYQGNKNKGMENPIFRKFSLLRRRNPGEHCWVMFAIVPENSGFPVYDSELLKQPCFIDRNLPHYFIWITPIKSEIQNFLKYYHILENLRLREMVLVDLNNLMGEGPQLRMYYHNMYGIHSPPAGIERTELWNRIESNCFNELGKISKNASKLNKYFWSSSIKSSRFNDFSRQGYRRIAHLTDLNGFLAFWALQDVSAYKFRYNWPFHTIPPVKRLGQRQANGATFILSEVRSYSFVSCYKTKSNFDILSALTSPLEGISWTLLASGFATVVIIMTALHTKVISDGVLLIIGISLENSVLLSRSIYEATFRREKHYLTGIYIIVAIWIVLVGSILTNWYKTWFTMEMIIPTIHQSPWESVMNVDGIRIMIPFYISMMIINCLALNTLDINCSTWKFFIDVLKE
ncbi:hypothetical protein Fcan01_25226 [Folsomia candida]|uniref:Uncharacterized protein n=1 Tax=Folsomia candida TaxID=158441 RepID=A0A226D2Q3_FOLCA|nr:hypothetical protein Fcan01_25226 [Folsomia candida]